MAELKKKATRESYGEALAELGDKYENLYVFDADLAAATKTGIFKKKFPDRFFDCGIAESNMMGVAAGMAATGKIPFASTFAMFAAHYKLDNLVAVVDNNGLQIDGKIEDVMSPYPIVDKFAAFGWHVITADAHDFDSLEKAFNEAETVCGQPCVIVMKSIKGKGVSFMENNVSWHGSAPNKEQYEQAVAEINEQLKSLEG